MGLKRPFGDELSELSFKHPRQGENGDRLSAYEGNVASDDSLQKPDISGTGDIENGYHKLQWSDIHADEIGSEPSKCTENDFEASAPFSWITSSSSEDDGGLGPTANPSLSPEYFGFNFPQRAVVSFEDIYSSSHISSPRSPRKQVPIGPNHQAIIPLCGRQMNRGNSDQTGNYGLNLSSSSLETNSTVNDGYEERLMGTCIIPMPDSPPTGDSAGDGRRDCSCLDSGSFRCVRQHVMEAREKLRDTLGQEKFINLGYFDMGEEVATKWSADEERVFHEVVYSNPRGNFWMNLSTVLPSRTKEELVSYYFNVFKLQRRAAQNRSKLLDIDSDDDEWHESSRGSYQVRVSGGEDFTTELPGSPEEEDDEDTDNDDDDDDDDSGDDTGAMDDSRADATDDGTIDYNSRFDSVVPHMDRSPGSYMENFDVQDNSCMSFECEGNNADTCGPVDGAGEVNRLKNNNGKCLLSKVDGAGDGFGLIYFLEPCDAKGWDARYPTDPVKSVDLLPTCNMIDEIFGQGTWNNKKIDG